MLLPKVEERNKHSSDVNFLLEMEAYWAEQIEHVKNRHRETLAALLLAYESHIRACQAVSGCPYSCEENECDYCIHSRNEKSLREIIEKITGTTVEDACIVLGNRQGTQP